MLGQAYIVVGFLKTICDTPKNEFTTSLKKISMVLLKKGFFPIKFKLFLLIKILKKGLSNLLQLGKTASLCGLNFFFLNCENSEH